MIGAAGQRALRVLYIVGENPAATDPDLNQVKAHLQSAEFVILQELFASNTADFADVLLPGAAWAEKCGTFANTERRVQPLRKAERGSFTLPSTCHPMNCRTTNIRCYLPPAASCHTGTRAR